MFYRLTKNAVLAECGGPALAGFKQSKKSVKKLAEADVEPEKKARSEKAAETAHAQPSVTAPEAVDRVLMCSGCRKNFDFTVRDQQFYSTMGFSDPKRCKSCRDKAEADRQAKDPRLPK